MRFRRDTARSVGDDENVVTFGERLDRRHCETDLAPERGQHKLLAPALLHDVDNALVLPCVDEGAVDRLLLREDILQPLDQITATFRDYRRQDRRHVEDFRSLG